MRKRIRFGLVLVLVTMIFATVPMFASGEYVGNVAIDAAGNVVPPTAPITRDGDLYTLTDDISGIIYVARGGITLDGDGYTVYGPSNYRCIDVIGGAGATHLTIRNFNLVGGHQGVYLAGSTGSVTVNNTIDSVIYYGIYIAGSNYNTVSGNTIQNSGKIGIHMDTGEGNTIIDNTIAAGEMYGISLYRGTNNLISQNTVSGIVGAGIYIGQQSYGNTVSGNILSNNPTGIAIGSTGDNTISDNIVSDSFNAIYLSWSNGNIVHGNTLANVFYGIYTYQSYDNTISGHTISGANHAIVLATSGSNTVNGNTVINSVNMGVELTHSNGNTVTGNSFLGNHYNIYILVSDGNIIAGNTASGSDFVGIFLKLSDNNVVTGNVASNNHLGIPLWESKNNVITGNTVTGNDIGFELKQFSDGNTIFHNNIIENTLQLSMANSMSTWDNGAGEGNYWSDYTGLDDGTGGRIPGDGVGDTDLPHQGVDWYPLMTPWSPDPFDAIQKLKEYIEGLDIHHGIKKSLLAQLNAAENALSNGQSKAAINILNAFINHVESLLEEEKLTQEQADYMIMSAQKIIDYIQGSMS
jgi:parallel beta-helix repeat protein